MKVITGPRQSGKTTEAIELANENDAYLVVGNQRIAHNIYHSDKHPDCDRFPMTFHELYNHSGKHNLEVVIDEIDVFLKYYSNLPVVGITATTTEAQHLWSGSDE